MGKNRSTQAGNTKRGNINTDLRRVNIGDSRLKQRRGAALLGPVGSVVAGGIGTVLVAACWFRLFPSLAHRDRLAKAHEVQKTANA